MLSPEKTRLPYRTLFASSEWMGAAFAAAAVLGLTWVVRAPLLYEPGFRGDQVQFLWWSEMASSQGLAAVYQPRPGGDGRAICNYPPVYIYVLRGLAAVYEWTAGAPLDRDGVLAWASWRGPPPPAAVSALYKLPAVISDGLTALLLAWSLRRTGRPGLAWGLAAAYAVLPGVWHDSSVWGQVDGVAVLPMLISLEWGLRRRISWMWVFAVAAVLTKAQAAILTPLWVGLTIVYVGRDWRRLAGSAAAGLASAAIIVMPIYLSAPGSAERREVLTGISGSLVGAAGYYPYTHLNGFSLWFVDHPLAAPALNELGQRYVRDDAARLFGLSARQWGLFGTLAIWGFVIHRIRRGRGEVRPLYWAACVLPVAFFTLSTQMHERYLYPAQALWLWGWHAGWRWRIGFASIVLCCAANPIWAWAGAPWLEPVSDALRRPWAGLPAGAWLGLLLTTTLVLMLWPDRSTAAAAFRKPRAP